jgi:hypothetical protein
VFCSFPTTELTFWIAESTKTSLPWRVVKKWRRSSKLRLVSQPWANHFKRFRSSRHSSGCPLKTCAHKPQTNLDEQQQPMWKSPQLSL